MDTIRATIPGTEAGKGYLKGLEGLLLTAKSNDDKYLYLSKVEMTQKNLRTIRKEFANHTTNNLHSDYDRAYFEALESYMRKLERTDLPDQADVESKGKKQKS